MSTKRLQKVRAQIVAMACRLDDELKSPTDMTLASVIERILVAEQHRMRPDNFAALIGVAAVLNRRWMDASGPPSFMTDDGVGLYTIEDIAKRLGISVEQAQQEAEKLLREEPDVIHVSGAGVAVRRVN